LRHYLGIPIVKIKAIVDSSSYIFNQAKGMVSSKHYYENYKAII
jgi:hypothetical protein